MTGSAEQPIGSNEQYKVPDLNQTSQKIYNSGYQACILEVYKFQDKHTRGQSKVVKNLLKHLIDKLDRNLSSAAI